MPRIARVVFPDIPHHITQRKNYQQNIFIGDEDRVKYLSLVAENVLQMEDLLVMKCLFRNWDLKLTEI